MAASVEKIESTTLIEEASKLLAQGEKLAILIIDEFNAEESLEDQQLDVSTQQEKLVSWGVQNQLLICFISDTFTRIGLTKIADGYDKAISIQKGDANGFGDGYSYKAPHFMDTGLDAALKKDDITHVIVMGFHVHCCVQATVGAGTIISEMGKGALQRGYKVLTAGDILKSSLSRPAGENRCKWKNEAGVTYFDSIGLSLEQSKEAHGQNSHSAFFTNIKSEGNPEARETQAISKCCVLL